MSARYFALLTNIGVAKIANAAALGIKLNITEMAVGDGGGSLPTPTPDQTALVNERRRAPINRLSIDPLNDAQIIVEQVIPENVGGWWIKEVGLYDEDGDLVAVSNCAETYKPLLQEGSGRTQIVRMVIIVSNTASVTVKIDPAVVLATRGYVDSEIEKISIAFSGPDGAYGVGYGLSTTGEIMDGFLSLRKFMTDEQWADANSLNPVLDHSSAFNKAWAVSPFIYVPPVMGCYRVKNVIAPFGALLRGLSYKPYTVSTDYDFYGCGSVIRKISGAESMFKWRSRTTHEGIVFDGLDKLTAFIQSAETYMPRNFRAIRCGFYRHQHAIGGPAGKYIGVQITDCQIANNFRGVYNTIDSMFTSVTINANDDDGVNLQKGANDNSFINCRMEWNGGNNFVASGSLNNTIIGELNDRAGKAGIAVISAEVFVIGVRMRRNGRYASGTSNSTHFRMEGPGAKLILSAIETKIGADDDGSGATTPEYSIYTTGASTDMTLIINGSNFAGSTGTHVYMAVRPDTVRISGNVGINDYSTVGANRTVNGFNYVDALTKQHSMPGQAITLPLSQPKYGETSRYMSREIEIAARDVNTGNSEFYWMKIQFSTESFGVKHYVIEEKSVPPNKYGTSGAAVGVAITNLSSDASTFNVVLTPTDQIEREVNIYLK